MRSSPPSLASLASLLGLAGALASLGACDKKLPTASHGSVYPSGNGTSGATGGEGGSGGSGGGATGATTGTGATAGTGSGGAGQSDAGHGGAGGQGGAGGSACLKCGAIYDKGGDPAKLCPDSAKLYADLQSCACPDTEDCYVACSDQLCANAGVPYQADCWSCLTGGCKYKNADCQSDL